MKLSIGDPGLPEHYLGLAVAEAAGRAGVDLQCRSFDGGGEARRIASVHEGMAEVSVGMAETVRWTYRAEGAYDGWRHTSLRALGVLQYVQWLGIAARWEAGIGTLEELRDERNKRLLAPLPGGRSATWSFITGRILSACGATAGQLDAHGWRVEDLADAQARVETADFDVLIAPLGAPGSAYARIWDSAAIKSNLRFISLPHKLLGSLTSDYGINGGAVPAQYLRGIDVPLSTLAFSEWVVVASERLEDEIALSIANALDEHRELFLPLHAWVARPRTLDSLGLPLHRAVKRRLQEEGIPATAAAALNRSRQQLAEPVRTASGTGVTR
jgi:TRAP-type uncharacterized transport system substrate-binding protein